jgi:hypothetical protein
VAGFGTGALRNLRWSRVMLAQMIGPAAVGPVGAEYCRCTVDHISTIPCPGELPGRAVHHPRLHSLGRRGPYSTPCPLSTKALPRPRGAGLLDRQRFRTAAPGNGSQWSGNGTGSWTRPFRGSLAPSCHRPSVSSSGERSCARARDPAAVGRPPDRDGIALDGVLPGGPGQREKSAGPAHAPHHTVEPRPAVSGSAIGYSIGDLYSGYTNVSRSVRFRSRPVWNGILIWLYAPSEPGSAAMGRPACKVSDCGIS